MPDANIPTRKIYALSDLSNSLKATIGKAYPGKYWIKAEIAKLNFYPKSGHCYPDLVEKSENKIKAQMRAIIWADDYFRIEKEFKKVTNEPLKEGINILFLAGVTYSPTHGLSLQIFDIEPSFTLGLMAQQKNETIQRLKKENLFDLNHQLAFPILPKVLAIISVETSKGFQDFKAIIDRNECGFVFQYHLFPSLLQGDQAVHSMIQQLNHIKLYRDFFDAVLIIRGGGGDVGLSCYDNYLLAREIAEFPIPIITGIGHSTNETVTEMVAHRNKITPTDLAYFLLDKFRTAQQNVLNSTNIIIESTKNRFRLEQKSLKESVQQFSQSAMVLLRENQFHFREVSSVLQRESTKYTNVEKNFVSKLHSLIQVNTKNCFKLERSRTLTRSIQLAGNIKQFCKLEQNKIQAIQSKITLLDPINVLKRGYSITTVNGKSLNNIENLKPNDLIHTKLYKGELTSIVQKIKK